MTGSERTVHDEIEVSAHHHVCDNGLDSITEFEIHTGLVEDEYLVTSEVAERVEEEFGLGLKNDHYRSGVPVRVVDDGLRADGSGETGSERKRVEATEEIEHAPHFRKVFDRIFREFAKGEPERLPREMTLSVEWDGDRDE